MRTIVAGTILGLVGAGAGWAQAPLIPLKVTASNDVLVVTTAVLSSLSWADGKGRATITVEPADSGLIADSEIDYEIKAHILTARIPFRKPAEPTHLKLRLTKVKDSSGAGNRVFEGKIDLKQSPSARDAAKPDAAKPIERSEVGSKGIVVGTPPSVRPESPAQGATPPLVSDPLAPVPPAQPAQAKASNESDEGRSFFERPPPPWLTYFNSGVLLLGLLIVVGLFIRRMVWPDESWQKIFRREILREIATVRSGVEQAQSSALEATRQVNLVNQRIHGPISGADEIAARIERVRTEVDALVRQSFETVFGQSGDVDQLVRVLREQARDTPGTNLKSGIPRVKREDVSATAIVNRWLTDGARNRQELLRLANELGVNARLASHKDLSRVFQDLTTFEYPFESSDDGPWLWVPVPGSNEVFATPADAGFFGMGAAPTLLDRLFEGMKNASQGFRFRAIYKPCRLRPVGGRPNVYALVEKGVLQLEGAPPPDEPRPPDYESLLLQGRPQIVVRSSGRPLGRLLADWVVTASTRIEGQSNEVGQLQGAVRNLEQLVREAGKNDSRTQNTVPEVERQLQLVERRVKEQADSTAREVRELTAQIESLRAKVEAVPLPSTTVAAPTESSRPSGGLDSTSAEPVKRAPRGAKVQPSSKIETESAREPERMPKGWRGALDQAALQSSSEPDVTDVPRQGLYVQRTKNLATAIGILTPEIPVAVVHLKKHPVDDTFEIHETEASADAPDDVFCGSCNARHTWQLAVCVGPRGSGDVSIVFPLGSFGKGNYASGYSALIDDLPSSSFLIGGIEQPAHLALQDARSGVYGVKRKMVWTKPVKTTEARV